MKTIVHEVGTVKIGVHDYRLVRTNNFEQAWGIEQVEEPPWDQGSPNVIAIEDETWHLGGFKSREGIDGATEYGTTDDRWPFQMLPGPKVSTLTLASGAGPVSFFEALGYIFVVKEGYVYRIHPDTLAVTLSKNFTFGGNRAGLRWETDTGLLAAHNEILYQLTAIVGGGPDTWVSGDAGSDYIAAGIDRLFGVTGTLGVGGLLRNVSTGLNPLTNANWADRVQCGRTDAGPTGMVAYENSVLVGKPEGLFGVSADEGVGVPLIKRMVYDAGNCYGMAVIEPYVLVPHKRGLYRLRPGISVESVGLEREVLNALNLSKSRFKGFAVDNQWIFACLEGPTGVDSYILVGRERRSGEASLGPIIWDTFINLGSAVQTRAIWISSLTSQPTLWFGNGNNVSYIKLPTGGGVPSTDCTFASSSVRYSPRYKFGDWNLKDFPKIQAAAKGVSETRYWSIAYSVDGGSWVTTDIDGAAMDIKSEGVKTFYFPITAVGREIQYRYTHTGPDADTAPAPLVYFRRFAVPRSKKVPMITAVLQCAEGIRHDMGVDPRTAIQQFNDLETYAKQAASITTFGPWVDSVGGSMSCWVRDARLVEVIQEADSEPELIVQVKLQKREAA